MKRGIEDSSDCETIVSNVQSTVNQINYQQSTTSPSPIISNTLGAYNHQASAYSSLPLAQKLLYPSALQATQQTLLNIANNSALGSTGLTMPSNSVILNLPINKQNAINNSNSSNTVINGNSTTTVASNASDTSSQSSVTTNPAQTSTPTSASSVSSIYSTSTTTKPEAKKAKTLKTQPSKVVHVRNIPQQITEIEIIQFGLIFGNIANVLNLRSKCQAFLEFEKCEEAQSMINYFANNPITVAGRQIFVQYSNYKNLITDPTNSNNQVAKAALDLAKELHKAAQTGGQNTVLRAMIQNMIYGVTLDTIYQLFSRYGSVLKIITFTKNDKFQALIQMKDAVCAQAAKNGLHGQNIYNTCCTLHIDYSKLNTLNVKYNNEKSRDYTNPLLPAGDCPDHLGLTQGAIFNGSLQLSLAAAAAAAAASYNTTPFATSLPSGYHFAPAGNMFISFPGRYLPPQSLITTQNLLQTSIQVPNSTTSTLTPTTSQSQTNSQQQHSTTQQSQSNTTSSSGAGAINSQQSNLVPLSAYGISQAPSPSCIIKNNASNNGVNGSNFVHQISSPHSNLPVNSNLVCPQTGAPILMPYLQNLNEDGFVMMYTT